MVQIRILILTLLIVIAGCIGEEKTVQKSENTKILKVTNGGDMTSWSSVIVENKTVKIGREVLQNYIFDSFINSENIFAIRGEYDKKNMDIGSWLGIQDSDIRLEFKDDELLIDISKLRERAIETGNSIPRWNMNIKIVVFKKSGEMIALASTNLFNMTADIKKRIAHPKVLVKDTGKEIEHFTDNGDVELSELSEGNYTFEINSSGYISKGFTVAISSRGAIQNFVTELTPQGNGMEGIFKVLFLPCGSSLGGTRKVLVYMPSDYNKDKNKKYPVLYMNDGQEIYTQWGVDRTMEALIREGKSKGVIIVGIYASANRAYEYPPWECKIGGVKWGGLGEEYCNFVINGVKPYIDKNFRTLPERENTSIFGSSDGGISALYIGLKYSNIFSKIGTMSTSFEYKEREILKFIEENDPVANTKIYLDSGNEGYRITDMNDVYNKFIEFGYSEKNVKKVYDPKGIHSPSSWGKRFPEAFLWLNEKE